MAGGTEVARAGAAFGAIELDSEDAARNALVGGIAMDAGDGTLEAKLVEGIGDRAGVELAESGDVFVHRVQRSGRQREKRFSRASAAALMTMPAKQIIRTPTNSVSVAKV